MCNLSSRTRGGGMQPVFKNEGVCVCVQPEFKCVWVQPVFNYDGVCAT